MVKPAPHRDARPGLDEDDKAMERSFRPVTAAWTRDVNGRQYGHFLDVARRPPRRSWIGFPVADPLSRWAYIWGTIATVTDMTFTAFIVPLSVAFNDYGDFGPYWIMDYIGSAIYLLDLVFEFHIGFIVRWDSSSLTITDGREVARHYVRHGSFWVDFIAALPIIAQIALSAADVSGDALRALLLLKLLRLVRVLKILGRMNRLDSGGVLHQYLSVRLNSVALLCWNLFYSLMVMINLIACLWWWAAVAEGLDASWVSVVQITKPDIDLENSGDWARWVCCAYYALVTMATIGYGDIVPVTVFEMGMVIIMVLAGVAYFGFVLSTVSAILAVSSDDGGGAGAGSGAVAKYQAMEGWLRRFSVSGRLQTDIRRFVFSHPERGAPSQRDTVFYRALPLWIKVRVAEELQAPAVTALLGGAAAAAVLPPEAKAAVAKIAALACDTESFRPGDRLHRAGDPIEAVIFLEEGELGLFVPGVMHPVRVSAPAVLGAGALFAGRPGGEACATWHSTARAVTSVLVWRVDAALLVRQLTQTAPQGLYAMMEHYLRWTEETIALLQKADAAATDAAAAAAAAAAADASPAAVAAEAAAASPGLRMVIERYQTRADVAAAAVQEVRALLKMVEEELADRVGPLPRRHGDDETGDGDGGDGDDSASAPDFDDLEGQAMAAEEQLERERVRRQITIQRAEHSTGVLRAMMLAGILRREGETTFVA